MSYKWCVVSQCTNTSIKTPKKMFVSIPRGTQIRRKWLMLARRNPNEISPSSNVFMCGDHFNLEQDMENYMQYKIMGSVKRILLKPNCVPSKFSWNRTYESNSNNSHLHEAVIYEEPQEETVNVEALSPCIGDDDSDQLLVCRGCCATGVKLFDLQSMDLKNTFEEFVGQTLNADTVKSIDRSFYKLDLDLTVSEPTFMGTDIILENAEDTNSQEECDIEVEKEAVEIKTEVVTDDDYAQADLDISNIYNNVDIKEEYDSDTDSIEESIDVCENIKLENVEEEIKKEDVTYDFLQEHCYIENPIDYKQEYDTEMVCIEETVHEIENDIEVIDNLECLPKDRGLNKTLFDLKDNE
ncbi:hypothetical protein evm_012705 [Chilo suppressalis]|nr:hypothetical protein evm_012705 [Chilo suppressalis]